MIRISTTTPGHEQDIHTAESLDALRDALVEESERYGRGSLADKGFADQAWAVSPWDIDPDEDEQPPVVREVTPELLADLASEVWDCPRKHVRLTRSEAMPDEELDSWLGDVTVTPGQREQLHEAAAMTTGMEADDRESEFSAMAQLILGDSTIDSLAAERQAAAAREADARTALYAGIRWAVRKGETAVSIQERTGVSRVTIGRLADQ